MPQLDVEGYTRLLQGLLPTGSVWPRDPEATLTKLLAAWAAELARVDERGDDLVDEADPRTAFEMLTDWERVCGLPGTCHDTAEGLAQRRAAVTNQLTFRGGQSRAFFISLAAALGYQIGIEEFKPLRAGDLAGSPAYGADWAFAWRVRGPEASTVSVLRAGGGAGERLRDWGNDLLECEISRRCPAHTNVLFAYVGVQSLTYPGAATWPVIIPKGPFNLHVMCGDAASWLVQVSYDNGKTWTVLPPEKRWGPLKETPSEGDSMGVLYQVVALSLEAEAINVEIGPGQPATL
ncbi:MAG: DUF2313 domain-containing protein [Deltaproteobacteria bacterium]|nr:DUF2313 domain-containing protein [Deltaproteobacteria bacterium]